MRLCDISNWEEIELFDDESETGGISYDGETLDNFVGECDISEDITIEELNKDLKDCGIRPIKIDIDDLFYNKAEKDLGKYVDMILGIEEHLKSQFSSPSRYMQWMSDLHFERQTIYDDILESYEMEWSDISVEEKVKIGFDYDDLGSAIAYLTDKVLCVEGYDGYMVWDTKQRKRLLSDDEKKAMASARKLVIDGKLKDAYELILTIKSGDYDGE